MWTIKLRWDAKTLLTVASGFKSRDEAEWAAGQWRASYRVYRDPFVVVREVGEYTVVLAGGERVVIAAKSPEEAAEIAARDGHTLEQPTATQVEAARIRSTRLR